VVRLSSFACIKYIDPSRLRPVWKQGAFQQYNLPTSKLTKGGVLRKLIYFSEDPGVSDLLIDFANSV
jgi:hypothetical protein